MTEKIKTRGSLNRYHTHSTYSALTTYRALRMLLHWLGSDEGVLESSEATPPTSQLKIAETQWLRWRNTRYKFT